MVVVPDLADVRAAPPVDFLDDRNVIHE